MADVTEHHRASKHLQDSSHQRDKISSNFVNNERGEPIKLREQRGDRSADNRSRKSEQETQGFPVRNQLDREVLTRMIEEWNATRLDIFRLTAPDANLVFEGNMRFYYREQDKSLTKCLKVKSSDTTAQVIAALTDKILGDMRMLTTPQYTLYEVHEGSEDNRLNDTDHPLFVQLNWLREDREGRFMLKNEHQDVGLSIRRGQYGANSLRNRTTSGGDKANGTVSLVEFVRRVSKRGRKKSHPNQQVGHVSNGDLLREKQHAQGDTKLYGSEIAATNGAVPRESDGSQLYREIPESSFHRSISNPEAVMRRRRAQKLERKLMQYRNAEGGPDTGGTLKIFGDALNPAVPYKTLLIGIDETAEMVVRQMLQKYGMEKKDPRIYCLVRTVVPQKLADRMAEAGEGMLRSQSLHFADNKLESITLHSYEYPLRIQFEFEESARQQLHQQQSANGQRRVRYADDAGIEDTALVFSIKPCSQALPPPEPSVNLPFLIDLETDERFVLTATNIIIGSSPQADPRNDDYLRHTTPQRSTQYIMLVNADTDILPQHCMLCSLGGGMRYSIDLMSPRAQVFVGQTRIVRKTEIGAGDTIKLGSHRFIQLMPPSSPVDSSPATMPKERAVSQVVENQRPERSPTIVQARPPDRNSVVVDGGRRQIQPLNSNGGPIPPQAAARAAAAPAVLPATLEFPDDATNDLLSFVLNPTNAENPTQFALSPAFTLYLAARYRASTTWHPGTAPMRLANLLAQFLFQTANTMHQTVLDVEAAAMRPPPASSAVEPLPNEIEDKLVMSQTVAYWLANITELLHFLRNDKHMNTFCVDAQEVLESTAIMACHILARQQHEIISTWLMPALDYVQRQNASATSLQNFARRWSQLVQYLDIIANIMIGCCLNGSLIVQLMSLLCQAVSAWCVNSILHRSADKAGNSSPLCSHTFGMMLFERISSPNGELKAWAKSKDLLHAVEISFRKLEEVCRVITELPGLTMPPPGTSSMNSQLARQRARQLNALAPSLNSVQLDAVLYGYHSANLTTITPLPTREFVEAVLNYAADTTDQRIQHAGGTIVLEEISTIGNYPFTMPDADYASDDIELGIPHGFMEFLQPVVQVGMVVVRTYPSFRSWAVYFHHHHHHIPPEVARKQPPQPRQPYQEVPDGRQDGERRSVPPPPVVRGPPPAGTGVERPQNLRLTTGTDMRDAQHPTIMQQGRMPPQQPPHEPPSPNEPPPPLPATRPRIPEPGLRPIPVAPPRPPMQAPPNGSNTQNATPVMPNMNANGSLPRPKSIIGYEQPSQQYVEPPSPSRRVGPLKIIEVVLQKKLNEGLGIKILSSYDDTYDEPPINGHINENNNNNAAVKNPRLNARISVTKVEPNSVAYADGQIEKDDILLAVNGVSLTGLTHQQAARAIQNASEASNGRLRFEVVKHG